MLKTHKMRLRLASAPDSAGEIIALPELLSGFEGPLSDRERVYGKGQGKQQREESGGEERDLHP